MAPPAVGIGSLQGGGIRPEENLGTERGDLRLKTPTHEQNNGKNIKLSQCMHV